MLYGCCPATCNRHAFDELGPNLCDVVRVNGRERTAQQYMDDLVAPPAGETVTTDEFAMYRFAGERIAEVWVTADNARLLPGQRPTSS